MKSKELKIYHAIMFVVFSALLVLIVSKALSIFRDKNMLNQGKILLEGKSELVISLLLNQVNKMLKQNPEMIKKVSKCVNSIFENKSLMDSLVSEIQTNVQEDQTFDNKTDTESEEAVSNESTQ